MLVLIGLLDPPRKEAIEAVRECHGGNIRVTMITGDHKITAAAIARMLGIGDGKTSTSQTHSCNAAVSISSRFCPGKPRA